MKFLPTKLAFVLGLIGFVLSVQAQSPEMKQAYKALYKGNFQNVEALRAIPFAHSIVGSDVLRKGHASPSKRGIPARFTNVAFDGSPVALEQHW